MVFTASFSDDTLKKEKQAAYTADTCLVSEANGERKSETVPLTFTCLPLIYLSSETSLLRMQPLAHQDGCHPGTCWKCRVPGSGPDLLNQRLYSCKLCSGLGPCVHVHVHVYVRTHACDYSRRLPRVRLPSLAGLFFSAYSLSHNFQNY